MWIKFSNRYEASLYPVCQGGKWNTEVKVKKSQTTGMTRNVKGKTEKHK